MAKTPNTPNIMVEPHGLLAVWQGLETALSRPAFVFGATLVSILSIGFALWLPNMELLRLIFASGELQTSQKISFLLEMYQILFRSLGLLQLLLTIAVALLIGVASVLLLVGLRRRHRKGIDQERVEVGLAVGAVASCFGLFGLSLLTPILTRDGLVTAAGSHITGTLSGLLSTGLSLWSLAILGRSTQPVDKK